MLPDMKMQNENGKLLNLIFFKSKNKGSGSTKKYHGSATLVQMQVFFSKKYFTAKHRPVLKRFEPGRECWRPTWARGGSCASSGTDQLQGCWVVEKSWADLAADRRPAIPRASAPSCRMVPHLNPTCQGETLKYKGTYIRTAWSARQY